MERKLMTPNTVPRSYRRRIVYRPKWDNFEVCVGGVRIGAFYEFQDAERNARFAPDRCLVDHKPTDTKQN